MPRDIHGDPDGPSGFQGVIHPDFGDLRAPDSVVISHWGNQFAFEERKPYCVHLSVTGRCNARCAGCINSSITFRQSGNEWLSTAGDTRPERDATAILHLLEGLGERDVVLSFYGGEPLLLPAKIESVISILSVKKHSSLFKYMIYTNGQLIEDTVNKYPGLIPRIWLWSVSIDGGKDQHESIRLGTSIDLIHRGLAALKPVRSGSLLMWSTLREGQSLYDCFDEFLWLFSKGFADNFFWHWVETDEPFQSLQAYLARYESDLTGIMDMYVDWLSNGKLLPIAHINELVLYLLTGRERGSSACGVELARNFDIMGGKVYPCADLPPDYAIGTIDENGKPDIRSAELNSLIRYKEDLGCYRCGVHAYCGGRCPVQALTGSRERLADYCQLMRLHVGTVQRYIPDIISLLRRRSSIDLQYIYDRSAFFARFTDVTP
ncbi:MAG: radical SAM protein [Dehalococcoidia bacterium]